MKINPLQAGEPVGPTRKILKPPERQDGFVQNDCGTGS